jgi:hypothetical protein
MEDIMDFGEILIRAWQIIWKHKILWIFGILASCSGGGGSFGGGGNYNNNNRQVNFHLPPEFQRFYDNTFGNFQDWQTILIIVAAVILILLVLLLITLIFIFLGTIGKIGIIRGVIKAEHAAKENTPPSITFGELFKGGLPYFWRFFFLDFLVNLIWAVGTVLGAIVLVLTIVGICFLIPYCCLLIPLGWLVRLYIEQCNVALVYENLSLSNALKRGWEITKRYLGNLIVMGLILIIGGGIVGLISMIPFFIGLIPLMVGLMAGEGNPATAGIILTVLCVLVYLPIFILLHGILRAYIQSAWTLTYMRVTSPTPPPPASISPPVEAEKAG